MTYEKKLPPVRQILKLANMVEFPATCLEVFKTAKRQGFSKNMLDFLSLYKNTNKFSSKAEFITRCEVLEMMINQEKTTPPEIVKTNVG